MPAAAPLPPARVSRGASPGLSATPPGGAGRGRAGPADSPQPGEARGRSRGRRVTSRLRRARLGKRAGPAGRGWKARWHRRGGGRALQTPATSPGCRPRLQPHLLAVLHPRVDGARPPNLPRAAPRGLPRDVGIAWHFRLRRLLGWAQGAAPRLPASHGAGTAPALGRAARGEPASFGRPPLLRAPVI